MSRPTTTGCVKAPLQHHTPRSIPRPASERKPKGESSLPLPLLSSLAHARHRSDTISALLYLALRAIHREGDRRRTDTLTRTRIVHESGLTWRRFLLGRAELRRLGLLTWFRHRARDTAALYRLRVPPGRCLVDAGWIPTLASLGATAQLVYLAIAGHDQGAGCWAGWDRLRAVTGLALSTRRLQESILRLIRAGLLLRVDVGPRRRGLKRLPPTHDADQILARRRALKSNVSNGHSLHADQIPATERNQDPLTEADPAGNPARLPEPASVSRANPEEDRIRKVERSGLGWNGTYRQTGRLVTLLPIEELEKRVTLAHKAPGIRNRAAFLHYLLQRPGTTAQVQGRFWRACGVGPPCGKCDDGLRRTVEGGYRCCACQRGRERARALAWSWEREKRVCLESVLTTTNVSRRMNMAQPDDLGQLIPGIVRQAQGLPEQTEAEKRLRSDALYLAQARRSFTTAGGRWRKDYVLGILKDRDGGWTAERYDAAMGLLETWGESWEEREEPQGEEARKSLAGERIKQLEEQERFRVEDEGEAPSGLRRDTTPYCQGARNREIYDPAQRITPHQVREVMESEAMKALRAKWQKRRPA